MRLVLAEGWRGLFEQRMQMYGANTAVMHPQYIIINNTAMTPHLILIKQPHVSQPLLLCSGFKVNEVRGENSMKKQIACTLFLDILPASIEDINF